MNCNNRDDWTQEQLQLILHYPDQGDSEYTADPRYGKSIDWTTAIFQQTEVWISAIRYWLWSASAWQSGPSLRLDQRTWYDMTATPCFSKLLKLPGGVLGTSVWHYLLWHTMSSKDWLHLRDDHCTCGNFQWCNLWESAIVVNNVQIVLILPIEKISGYCWPRSIG